MSEQISIEIHCSPFEDRQCQIETGPHYYTLIIIIYFLAFLPSVSLHLSCSSRWAYITYISVSKSTPLAVTGPNGQLASRLLHCLHVVESQNE